MNGNMKFVHIADMHFDSPFIALSDKGNLGEQRRIEQRKIFKKVIEYIKENGIKYLFISGDLYEHQHIRKSTIEYINNLFKEIPHTKIFIAPGNHDPYLKKSYYSTFNWNNNVHIFGPKIEKIELESVDIYGFGFNDFYCSNFNIEKLNIENPEKINILIIHGTLDGSNAESMQYNSMSTTMLKQKGFNYIALGHIHKNNFEKNLNIIYPGSMISLGFDELGEHGMVAGEISDTENKLEFIKLDDTEFVEVEIDCIEINSIESLIEKINEIKIEENKLYKIILTGKRNFEINIYDLYKYELNERIIKIKNKTKPNFNIEEIAKQNTLRGLFAQEILQEINNENYTEEIIEQALEIGMEVLE
ncbi:MAG: DNA repair exonuclease [Clostridia bacterium]|nr:DNA repair exonuclease [Clostridia bacterium]